MIKRKVDYLWSPWRYRYLQAEKPPDGECIFCRMAAEDHDQLNLIVYRGPQVFAVLNKFPYTSGHMMVVPYAHSASLEAVDESVSAEIMALTRIATRHVASIYRPDGLNVGMNIGEAAGAGVAGHIHMHVLPRWRSDANFMTTIGETRILPEELDVTWKRLHDAFQAS